MLTLKDRDERYKALRAKMKEAGFDAMLVICDAQIEKKGLLKYLTNYRNTLYNLVAVFPLEGTPKMLVPSPVQVVWAKRLSWINDVVLQKPGLEPVLVDTIKQILPSGAVTTPDRNSLRAVQTPQTFNYDQLMSAHRKARAAGVQATDDAALYEYYYGSVRLVTVDGAEENKKLTLKSDFDALKQREMPLVRMGQGYDAHRLKEGRRLVLCGVEVPHVRGLDGHSDADVAVHALMDAMLGALGEGDIGRHFPDNDPAYAGICSMRLLEKVMEIVEARGYHVGNADVTIVAQKPKLAGFIPRMRENLAEALDVSVDCANVKATTTERMGFEGEETGISAHAVCLLIKNKA